MLKHHNDMNETGICEGVQRALIAYVSDKLDLTGAGLTVDDVTQHLNASGVDRELIERTESLLHLCDSARYAPGSLAVAQLNGLVESAESLVQRLEAKGQR
jgi:hypothetical protein